MMLYSSIKKIKLLRAYSSGNSRFSRVGRRGSLGVWVLFDVGALEKDVSYKLSEY